MTSSRVSTPKASAPKTAARKTSASTAKAKEGDARRSPCPLACCLDLFGDRWTLLVVRDLVMGAERFKQFAASPEHIPTNVLSERLVRLQRHEVIEQFPATDGTKHPAYRLTPKGKALYPVLEAMRDWGLAWEKGAKVMLGKS
jgi:DNA-binding HxlR family transcriptional regulator